MCNLDLIEQALSFISPDLPRDDWALIGMAIKSECPNGFDIFDKWSKNGKSYNKKDVLATWQSIKPSGGITIGTLFYLAQQNGWVKKEGYHFAHKATTHKIERDQEKIKIQAQIEETGYRSRKVWEEAVPASANHSYLVKKQVVPIGIGEITCDCAYLPQHIRALGRFLVVPMHDINGIIWCVQFISETGEKSFIKGKQKSGIFFRIGEDYMNFAIVESAITGFSYHYLSGETVYCAFSAGALKKVGKVLRNAFPYAAVRIIADDDWAKPTNTGVSKALEAASSINAKVYKPDFEGFIRKPGDTDFNDLCVLRGQYGSD